MGTVRILWFFLVLRNFWVGTVKKTTYPYRYRYNPKSPYSIDINTDIDILKYLLVDIDIDNFSNFQIYIDIEIFQDLDIEINIDIF